MAKIFLSLIAIASLGGIFTVASGSSVPGNILYPFKVGVCESIGRLLAVGDVRGDYAVEMANQRLLEFEVLIQNNAATSDRQTGLLDSFDVETQNVESAITVFQADEKFDQASALAQKFETMLSTHIAVFTALQSPAVPHLQSALETISGTVTLPSKTTN